MSDKPESELLQSLRSENQSLSGLVISLTELLRNIALHPHQDRRDAGYAERFLLDGEQCFRLARSAGLTKEIGQNLAAAGHAFIAKAVEIETALVRDRQQQ
jgi:hypothetical protein